MRDSDANAEQLVTKADSLPIPRTTPEQARRAALVVCDRTDGPGEAADVLELLGLIQPGSPSPKRWDSVPVVHGTRSAVAWHERQPLPHHRALCPACIRYVEVQDRSAKRPKLRVIEGG